MKGMKFSRDNPDVAKPIIRHTAALSGVGVAFGVGVALYRKSPVHVYALGVGLNFALCSFTFFGELTQRLCGYHGYCKSFRQVFVT